MPPLGGWLARLRSMLRPHRGEGLGRRGERLARRHLRRSGMRILAVNYRCPAGEADLIALDPTTRREFGAESIVFVEVKTRSCDRFTDPESAVDATKQKRLRRVAQTYLSSRDTDAYAVRFDVVAIVFHPDGEPEVRHIRQAF